MRLTRFVFSTHCLAQETSAWRSPIKCIDVRSWLSFLSDDDHDHDNGDGDDDDNGR